jgi:hypothetical protein
MKLAAYLHLMRKLRMSEDIPPPPHILSDRILKADDTTKVKKKNVKHHVTNMNG